MVTFCVKEKWKCWLCGGKVPVEYVDGEPSAPSKDHVIPRSIFKKYRDKYSHDFFKRNLRLAHRHCNFERRSREVKGDEEESYAESLAKAQVKWDKKRK